MAVHCTSGQSRGKANLQNFKFLEKYENLKENQKAMIMTGIHNMQSIGLEII